MSQSDFSRRPVLALKPLSAQGNRYSGLFSGSIDDRHFEKMPFDWNLLGKGAYDIVVFHWPTEFFRPESRLKTLKLISRMKLDKIRNKTKFVWVVHNISPHDGGNMDSALCSKLFIRTLDGLIFLSDDSHREALSVYPSAGRKRKLVTVHGAYPVESREPAEFSLREGAVKLVFFGLIREYKNVVSLIEEMKKLESETVYLSIIGKCEDEDLEKRIRDCSSGRRNINIDIRNEVIPDAELEALVDAHDAVVIPYRRVLNSGVALHALGRNKPILAPRMGSLPELEALVGRQWVNLYDGDISSQSIDGFVGSVRGLSERRPDLSRFGWDRVGGEITEFLLNLGGRN